MEVQGLPLVDILSAVTSCQFVKHRALAVPLPGSADFPKIIDHHVLEVGPAGAKFRMVEDGFAPAEFVKNTPQRGLCDEVGFHFRTHNSDCKALIRRVGMSWSY